MGTEHNGVDRLGRRAFLRMTALSGGAMIIAACGGAAPDPATSNTSATDAPAAAGATAVTSANAAPAATAPGVVQASGDQVTIDWANRFTTDVTQKVIPLMVAEFEKLYPNIKVKYQNPGVSEGYNETILGRIAAGDPPDVYILDTTPAEYAARGSLLDITDRMTSAKWAKPDAFYPAPLGSCQWQGKTYGLPSSAGPGSVFTNIDMFTKKGVPTDRAAFPKTWDEAKALSKEFVVSDNGAISQAGFVPFVGGGWLYPVWSALNGGQIYDAASNSYKLTSDNNVQWLEYWVKWLDEQYGGNYEAFTTAGNWDDAYPESQFAQSKQAIVHTGSWVTTDAQIPFKFEATKFPVGPSGSKSVTGFYPNWWTIPAGSKHADEAFLFIEFIATKGWKPGTPRFSTRQPGAIFHRMCCQPSLLTR